jgi:hypothetical protein
MIAQMLAGASATCPDIAGKTRMWAVGRPLLSGPRQGARRRLAGRVVAIFRKRSIWRRALDAWVRLEGAGARLRNKGLLCLLQQVG